MDTGTPKKNTAQSVLDRLNKKASELGETAQSLHERYVAERYLYRISRSLYGDRLILKGGTLFLAWLGKSHRVTKDIDFIGFMPNNLDDIKSIFQEICETPVEEDDGIVFLIEKMRTEEIKEDADYHGVRTVIPVKIGTANIKLVVDIAFGDAITPGPQKILYPSLLGMSQPEVLSYPIYSVIAEKFEAMVQLGIRNSRVKDFYDIWFISQFFALDVDGQTLQEAIKNTFAHRGTDIPVEIPIALTLEFYLDKAKEGQWDKFIKTSNSKEKVVTFSEGIEVITAFIMPIVEAIRQDVAFTKTWVNATGWQDNVTIPQ